MNEQSIFLAALDIADLTERQGYVNQACHDDPQMRQQVESLLAAHERSGEFLDVPVFQQIAAGMAQGQRTSVETSAHEHRQQGEIDLFFLEPSGTRDSLGRLKHYDVKEVIGRGGCGIVLKAFDEILHRTVAIKVMAPELAATSPARKRFLREARAAAGIRQENVVSIHAVEDRPIPFLVMEYIAGQTLQQKIDQTGPLEVRQILSIGHQIACGLEAAHAIGLIHRDIKPGNILIEKDRERVKITDFGLARASDDASLTQSGAISGTPLYMSPEQARGNAIDQRSDLFSLGSVLYVMCSGRPPFRAANMLAVLKRVAEDQPRPIREIIPEAPEWLIALITRLHAKEPDERFASAKEMAGLLSHCLSELERHGSVSSLADILQSVSKPPDVPGRTARALRSQAGSPSDPVPPSPFRSPNRNRWILAACVLGTLLAGLSLAGAFGVTSIQRSFTRLFSTDLADGRQVIHDRQTAKPSPIPIEQKTTAALPSRFQSGIGMDFVLIPRGKSWLGGGGGKFGATEILFEKDFYMGQYTVTQEEWVKVMEQNPCRFSRGGAGSEMVSNISAADLKRYPVEMVSWDECLAFIDRLNKKLKEPGWIYRLPTEAEWEYSCRGGPLADRFESAFDFYFDRPRNELRPDDANFGKGWAGQPCSVGLSRPNTLGLYDMHGNVHQWCQDDNSLANDIPGDFQRVLRGGSYFSPPHFCRAATRLIESRSFRQSNCGLRLVRVAVDVE